MRTARGRPCAPAGLLCAHGPGAFSEAGALDREQSAGSAGRARGHAARAGARRRTQAALEIWQEMADKASTPSTVLLPPAKRARTGEPGAAEAAPGAAHRQAPAADECGRAPGGDGSAIHQGHDQAPADAPPRAALAAEARSAAAAAVEGEAAQA